MESRLKLAQTQRRVEGGRTMSLTLRIAAFFAALCLPFSSYLVAGPKAVGGEASPETIVAILNDEPAFILPTNCEPGQPVLLLRVRVTNKGRVNTPAVPTTEGVASRDKSTPPWSGTAALPPRGTLAESGRLDLAPP
jgi:hypothetical protein